MIGDTLTAIAVWFTVAALFGATAWYMRWDQR